jgi:hypothetical protein
MSFIDGSVRLKIRFPKVFASLGVCVDLFPIQDPSLCPVECFRNLCYSKKPIIKQLPIFMFSNGKLLTPHSLNDFFRSSLKPLLGDKAKKKYSSHSFRSSILAALANHPSLAGQSDIMGWGTVLPGPAKPSLPL